MSRRRDAALRAGALELAESMRCITASELGKILGRSVSTAKSVLEELAASGQLRKYMVMNKLAAYCAPSASPGAAIRAVLRSLGVREKLLLRAIKGIVEGARGRKICISVYQIYRKNTPATNAAVLAYMASVLGGVFHRGRYGRTYVCADAEEAKRRVEAEEIYPPDGVVRLAERRHLNACKRRASASRRAPSPPPRVEASEEEEIEVLRGRV
ncbi:hypothetical protein [Pyrobaculum sp.]|uniref:hypothetical protein n=1 Tax=Pyrobaculum sp. TaxID=2004705 RepID=UPI003D1470EE